jgi:hypothetical protein
MRHGAVCSRFERLGNSIAEPRSSIEGIQNSAFLMLKLRRSVHETSPMKAMKAMKALTFDSRPRPPSTARLGLDVWERDLPSLPLLHFVTDSAIVIKRRYGSAARGQANVYMTSRSCEPLSSTKTSTTHHRPQHGGPPTLERYSHHGSQAATAATTTRQTCKAVSHRLN